MNTFPKEWHISVPLADIIREKELRRSWTIDLPDRRKGLVDLEFKWLGLLD